MEVLHLTAIDADLIAPSEALPLLQPKLLELLETLLVHKLVLEVLDKSNAHLNLE